MKNLLIALSIAALSAALVHLPAQAQQARSAGRGGAAILRGNGPRPGAARHAHSRRPFAASAYAPYLYSDSGYDSGLGYGSADESMLEPPPIGEPLRAAAPSKPAEAVLLELEGDRWVRITSNGPPQIDEQPYPPELASNPAASASGRQPEAAKPPAEPPSAVLVFRDGHQEEIGQYRIMGATIYINTDYWSTGSWTREVHVCDLDIPATLKLNQQRGTHFRLPAGPYEVMMGE